MGTMASQTICVYFVCSTVCSGSDQRIHQTSASLAFVRGIHRWPVNSPHKGAVTRKMFPFDDVIMMLLFYFQTEISSVWLFQCPWFNNIQSGAHDNPSLHRYQFGHVSSQWETSLPCYDVSHWLGAYLNCSLHSVLKAFNKRLLQFDLFITWSEITKYYI